MILQTLTIVSLNIAALIAAHQIQHRTYKLLTLCSLSCASVLIFYFTFSPVLPVTTLNMITIIPIMYSIAAYHNPTYHSQLVLKAVRTFMIALVLAFSTDVSFSSSELFGVMFSISAMSNLVYLYNKAYRNRKSQESYELPF